MRRWFTLAAGTGLLLAGCTDSRGPTQPTVRAPSFLETQDQHGPRTHIMMPRGQANPHKGGGNTGINYHGGPGRLRPKAAPRLLGAGAPLRSGAGSGIADAEAGAD